MSTYTWTDAVTLEDPQGTAAQIADELRAAVRAFGRSRAVVGVSGGIDSAVTLAVAVRALGARRVTSLMLPDRDSSGDSERLGRQLAEQFGVKAVTVDITSRLEAWDAYGMRDSAALTVFPAYDPVTDGIRAEFVPRLDDENALPLFCLTRVAGDGTTETRYLKPGPYLEIVAATNLKQRMRMTALYHLAEQQNAVVIGTANRLEVEQGFFVKHGDGAGDLFPLQSFYKSQVYRLAAVLDIPSEIVERPPTTDTYSAAQTQEEFFYGLPVETNDLMWAAFLADASSDDIAGRVGLPSTIVTKVLEGFERRTAMAAFLRDAPIAEANR